MRHAEKATGRRPALAIVVVLIALVQVAGPRAAAAPLVADLSNHLVAITTGFAGTHVLLFGAVDQPGDVVVVVRGPREKVTLHRKSRVAGIWVNTASMTFEGVWSFYAIASSAPLDKIAPDSLRRRHGLGVNHANAQLPPAKASRNIAELWEAALIRSKQRLDLYAKQIGGVRFLGNQLFRTQIFFPANVPTGIYQVDTFLIRDGRVISAQKTPLTVSKVGIEADVFDFAHEQASFYGFVAIVLALVAGWLAHAIFGRT